jgi:hypothetical protein
MTRKHLFAFIVFAGLFAMAVRPAVDPDLGWHLRTGQLIAQSHSVPHQDPFSFTKSGSPWIAHEWLSELLMYGLSRLCGTTVLIIFFALIVVVAFALVYRRCDGRPYAAGLLTLWGAIVTIPAWGVRPQTFTVLFASVFLLLLDRYMETGQARWLLILPAVMVLWVNLHAGFAAGIALVLLYGLAEALDGRRKATLKHLGLAALGCVAVIPANPNGLHLITYPFQTLTAPSITGYIQEWASPDFHLPIYRLFLLLVVFAVVVLARAKRRPTWNEAILFLFTLTAALVSARHIPFFILVAVPVLSRRMPTLETSERRAPILATAHSIVALFALVAVGTYTWTMIQRERTTEAKAFPVRATKFLEQHALPPPVFNNYDWGGYLIAHSYPKYRVFVDGRSDLYGDSFLSKTVNTYQAHPGWDATLASFGIRTVFIGRTSPLATVLRESRDWTLAYEDEQAAVFTRHAADSAVEPK